MRRHLVVAAIAAALGLGCASSGGSTAGAAAGARRPATSRELIPDTEIAERAPDATNALEIVQKLRPQMLTGRGLASPNDDTGESTQPKVYVDNIFFGQAATLRDVAAAQIKEIRFINARDATTQWGTGHMGGVILVTTKKR